MNSIGENNNDKHKDNPIVSTLLQCTHKQDILMNSLIQYYNKKENIDKLLTIFKETSPISLRVIDWFVTNYSKKNKITFIINNNFYKNKLFNVYDEYKQQLKGYSKKQFDPFCRRERIKFCYNENNHILTTVGQLNFFRWANENKIIEYIKNNLKDIETDMNDSYRNQYGTKIKKNHKNDSKLKSVKIKKTKIKRKTRHELSKSACKSLTKYNTRIELIFD
jgi:hypothetical protein|tara:strand:- start:439 stop:1101 length:663 start_codon:yes stop_codon:yes gene_type:complete